MERIVTIKVEIHIIWQTITDWLAELIKQAVSNQSIIRSSTQITHDWLNETNGLIKQA